MVVFLWPEDTTRSWIKRVVGLPGDTLGMRDGVLQVNGRAQHEDYLLRAERTPNHTGDEFSWQKDHLAGGVQQTSGYRPSRDTWGPIVVPEDAYFVLGDNRDNSADSRYWGFVRGELLFARPWRIHFSRDPKTGAVRWQRMGVFLDGSLR
jgi:signal peptidase I